MLYSLVDGIRSLPTPGARGICPQCETRVFARCGEVLIHHWAHFKDGLCDSLSDAHEGEWHLGWKLRFPDDWREVRIARDGKHHRADVLTPVRGVIEFQASPITREDIAAREQHYSPMTWVFDAREAFDQDRLVLIDSGGARVRFAWGGTKRVISSCTQPVYLDLGNGSLLFVQQFAWEPGRTAAGWGFLRPVDEFVAGYAAR